MNYSLKHLIRKPKIAIENPPLLLMLHGYGSNEEDLFSFAQELPDELLIISARAPLNIGYGGYAWYSIHFETDDSKFSDIPEAINARDLILTFIDELQETYHFNPNKSFLMGFSQGTILSYAIALSYPNKIKNIIALSGYLNEEMLDKTSRVEHLYKNLDFFCSHGTQDTVIPVVWARKTISLLEQKGINLIYNEYPAGHGVHPQNFLDFKDWLVNKL